jgi:toxin YoeB
MLTSISYSELRQTLKAALDRVCDTRVPLRVTRRNGERVVVLPESDYEALEETVIGKPEQLKHHLSGLWSRRINQEHRLVYKVEGASIMVYSCRYHY